MDNFKEHNDNESKRHKEAEEDQRAKYDPSKMQSQQNRQMKQYMGGNNNLGNMSNYKMPSMPKFK